MLYCRKISGSVSDTVERIRQAVKRHKFGIVGEIDLKAKMADKGVSFGHECMILEVCNPHQAKKVLEVNPAISTALPCRISIYEQDGQVVVATVKPTVLLEMYEKAASVESVAKDVEATMIAIIDESISS